MVILTQWLKKLKSFMGKILNRSRLWGPLLTVVFTCAYHYGVTRGWYEVSLALIFLFVAAGAFVSGLRGGLAAGAWGSVYGWYVMLPGSRLAQTIIGMVLLALMVGYSTRRLRLAVIAEIEARRVAELARVKAEIFDSLTNGNVAIFKRYLKTTDQLIDGWSALPDDEKLKMVQSLRGNMSDLTTLAKGFDYLAKQRGFVIEHYSTPESES